MSAHDLRSSPAPRTYQITITFDDGTFLGRATSNSELNAYSLILQDARMGSSIGPQYHGKVLEWTAVPL